jgi:hypothetical protein
MRFIALAVLLLMVVSCTQVPKQESYPLTYQKKMQAAEHWRFLAIKVSQDWNQLAKNSQPAQVYISSRDKSEFGRAMRSLLITELMADGITISRDPSRSFVLDWEVQPVRHAADRYSQNGIPMALLNFLQAITVGGFYGDCRYPHSEVIITFNLFNPANQQVPISRRSYIFYVNDADVAHYPLLQPSFSESALKPVSFKVVNN